MVVEDGHAVDDPPECKDLHSDYADCYGHFHPVGIISFRSVPVEGDNRCIDSVYYNADDRDKGSPSCYRDVLVAHAIG